MRIHSFLIAAAVLGLVVSTVSDSKTAPVTTALAAQEANRDRQVIRFATFNVSMNRNKQGGLLSDLESSRGLQFGRIAEVIQRVRPDVLLLNEFDYDEAGKSIALFQKNFLGVGQNAQDPIDYPHVYFAEANTGVASGVDINRDGKVALPDDGFGFGAFAGQYGMVVLSRYPIDSGKVRTFRKFLWKDMPNARRPMDPKTNKSFYPDADFKQMRLSSKSHWDVPILIGKATVHLICSHPTPPVFDGAEDRNGNRNHDEIRMIADYISGNADYLYDDKGETGGLAEDASFVIVGDLNADPFDGDSTDNAARQLTENERVNHSVIPASDGAVQAAKASAGKSTEHQGDPAFDTGDFNDRVAGNVRVDYCLPSTDLVIQQAGVFWPKKDDPVSYLNKASDHHMVWVEVLVRHP